MIPRDWIPHRRGRDSELVGYLAPIDDLFQPMTLFGYPLADAADYVDAEQVLEDHGLRYLAEPWHLQAADGWRRVRIVEVNSSRIVVGNYDFGNLVDCEANIGDRTVLEVPTGRLRPQPTD